MESAARPEAKSNEFTMRLIQQIACFLCLVALVGCSAEARKEKYLSQADKAYSAGQYDQAEIDYLNVLKFDAANAHAMARLGTIYFDQGSPVRGIPYLLRAKELDSDDRNVRIRIASFRLATRQLPEARAEASFVLERNPKDPEAPAILSASIVQARDVDEIKKIFDALPADAQGGIPVLIARGNLALQGNNLKEAEAFYRKAVGVDPKSPQAQLALGLFLWNQKDMAGAEKALSTAAEFAPPRSATTLQYLQFKIRNGDAAAARKALEDIVKKTPDFIGAQMMLAELAASENKPEETSAILEKILARDGSLPEALMLRAKLKLAQGQTAKALEELERIQKMYPQSPQVLYTLAQASIANGDSDRALSLLAQATALAPDYADALLMQAATNLNRGELNPAIVTLKRLVALRPDIVQAKLLLAEAYRAQGNYALATPIYDEVQKATPTNPEPAYLSGVAYFQANKLAEARQSFRKALQLSPKFFPALNALVDLEVSDGQVPVARKLADDFLAQNPQNIDALALVGRVQMQQGDNAGAEATLLKAISMKPDMTTPYYLLARLYLATNQQDKAMSNIQEAVAKKPTDTGGQILIGILQEQKKDYAAAKSSYEKVLAIDPKSGIALNNLAFLYADQLGDLNRGFDLAQKARDLLPKESHVADTYGWILFKKKEFAKALTPLKEAAAGLKDSPDVQYHLGMDFYMLGDEAPAKAAFESALKASPTFPGSEDAKRRLAVLNSAPDRATVAELEKAAADQNDDPIILSRLAARYVRAGTPEKAVSAYEGALRVNPNNSAAVVALSKLYRQRKDSAKATALLDAARKAAPDDPSIAAELARIRFDAADYDRAYTLLQEAVRKAPDDPEIQLDFARAALSIGRFADAENAAREAQKGGIEAARVADARQIAEIAGYSSNPATIAPNAARIQEAARSDPASIPLKFLQGMMQEQRGDIPAARATYEAVLERSPKFFPAQKRLAVILAALPEASQQGFEIASKAREALPNDAELARAFGILVYRRGDYSRAASLLQESVTQFPNDAEAQYYLGMALLQQKQDARAKPYLEKAISLGLKPDLDAAAKKSAAALTK